MRTIDIIRHLNNKYPEAKLNKKDTGYILYTGPSCLAPDFDNQIVVILTGFFKRSDNEKTGNMIQSWILGVNKSPMDLRRGKEDSLICGKCPFTSNRGCYVSLNPLQSIYKSYLKGNYKTIHIDVLLELFELLLKYNFIAGLRLGSYGDPAAVPFSVFSALVELIREKKGKTSGYTHQWAGKYRNDDFEIDERYKSYLMASCHGIKDYIKAKSLGWRAFVTFSSKEAMSDIDGIIPCPASEEGGYRRTCSTCGGQTACNGSKGKEDKRVSIGLVVHGSNGVKSLATKQNTTSELID